MSGENTPSGEEQVPPTDPQKKKFNNGWTPEIEELMGEWADRASYYRWMHERTGRLYRNYDRGLMFPVIILSTITGTASFGIDSFFGPGSPNLKYAQSAIGGLSLFAGILTTIANYLAYAKEGEAHRVAAVSWGKFNRLICIEMALNPNERNDCFVFLKSFRIELDRLIEQSPDIPPAIRKECLKTFKNATDVKKPDILGVLEHTNIYKDTDTRLKKLAADAALVLQQKKGVLKQLVLEDLDGKIRAVSIEAARGVAQEILATRTKFAKNTGEIDRGTDTPVSARTEFSARIVNERKQELSKVANSGLVSELKQRIARRSSVETIPGAVPKKESENVVITIPEYTPRAGLSNLVQQSIPIVVQQQQEEEFSSGSTEFVTACDSSPANEEEVVIDLSGAKTSESTEPDINDL